MDRKFYLELAASGLRMPIGTHLVLHEKPDHTGIVLDGQRLGGVVEETAKRFRTPLAIPLMDLKLEKEALLVSRGVTAEAVDTYHFTQLPQANGAFRLTKKMAAACDAIRHVAAKSDLVPVGMSIGPFSLMTKLLSDPISPVFMAGTGLAAAEDPEVALMERLLEMSLQTVQTYLESQITAGARAVLICEPAANKVFFSPNQLAESYDIFERYVMKPNRAIRDQLRARGVDLIFHDCGELLDGMVERLASLEPAILSLGSSRRLWEDAALVSKTTVLYGNLPSKQFYSDKLVTAARVRELGDELTRRMREAGHPFILGTECDVLSVAGCEETIMAKVQALAGKE
jgi:uroporphyrinogen-III decarboxylase